MVGVIKAILYAPVHRNYIVLFCGKRTTRVTTGFAVFSEMVHVIEAICVNPVTIISLRIFCIFV